VEWGHCAFPPRLGGGPPGCGALRGWADPPGPV